MSRDRVLEYALGLLEPQERRELEAAAMKDDQLRGRLHRIRDELAVLEAAEEPTGVPADGRAKLMSALEGPAAFLPFLDELIELFDLDEARMQDVLAQADRSDFHETGVPGVQYLHFAPGPALDGAEAGLVRFAAKAVFPEHEHAGRELTYVLRGALYFSDGTVLRPGDKALLQGGRHSVRAGDEPVLYLTYHEGLKVLDENG